MSDADAYREWILGAEPRALIDQLDSEVRQQLVSIQNFVNILALMQNPSPGMRAKMERGELDAEKMLADMAGGIEHALAVLDFFKESLASD
jgi:hypothetical protein